MIIVTGAPRTGTSMVMQTLVKMGVKTPAPPFLSKHQNIINHNPKGFYELYREVINGVKDDRYKGQVLKMWPPQILKSNVMMISHLIVCRRNPFDAIKSYEPIHKKWKEPYTPKTIYQYNSNAATALAAILPSIHVSFEMMRRDPEREIRRLAKFLKIPVHPKKLEEAIKNIEICQLQQQES